jgi:hypothetical protein
MGASCSCADEADKEGELLFENNVTIKEFTSCVESEILEEIRQFEI